MHTIGQFDLSTLPIEAQNELYDFYLFLQQRYVKTQQTQDKALNQFLNNNKQRFIKVNSDIDLSELANESNDMDI